MYYSHQPIISNYSRANPQNMLNTFKFVFCTIQQSLDEAVKQAQGLTNYDPLFGFKMRAYLSIEEEINDLYDELELLYSNDRQDLILYTLQNKFGLGVVKAGFVCQLIYGFAGCIDTHNLQRFNIKYKDVAITSTLKEELKRAKCERYLALCEQLGGTQYLWDSWCEYVANNNPQLYTNCEEVSYLHVIGTGGK